MPTSEVVHVVDDDDALRDALAFMLRSRKYRVRSYESAAAFLSDLPDPASGCLITDIRMPEIDGIQLLQRLRDLRFEMPVIVITAHGDVQLAVEAMKIGAVDFLEKPFDDSKILDAVRQALDGRGRASSNSDPERAAIEAKLASLSQREMQVLQGLVRGHPNKTIAYDLDISARTVEIYRANVMDKMGATSLAQLIRMATIANVPSGAS